MVGLVIFDCDGVLVDSESIAVPILLKAAISEGAEIVEAEAFRLFRGQKFAHSIAEIEQRSGRKLPKSFELDIRAELARAFEANLKAIDGIHTSLAEIARPFCVASNGPIAKIRHVLKITNLLEKFEGHIFSAYEIGSWKPDPGLFLHAANFMGIEPSRCLVVEDSLFGIQAAQSAGMKVLGFTNGDMSVERNLKGSNVPVFHKMSELPDLIALFH